MNEFDEYDAKNPISKCSWGQNLKLLQKLQNFKILKCSFLAVLVQRTLGIPNFFVYPCRGDDLEQIHV